MNIHLNCPIPFTDSDRVLLAHGGGGRMTHQLISQVFYPAFRNPLLEQDHDGCVFPMEEGRLAYSTDSFVVDPISPEEISVIWRSTGPLTIWLVVVPVLCI